MQEKWKDLIPFYVADTLSDSDRQALEAYLIKCGDPCQDEINEWRVIASATWQHVNTNNLDLPPLSPMVLQEVAKDAPFRVSNKVITSNQFRGNPMQQETAHPQPIGNKKLRPASRFPMTMVAAFMTVLIFGGILLSQLAPNDLEPQTLIQLTNANESTVVTVTEEFGGAIGIQPTNPNDGGIIATPTQFALRPTATFTYTPVPLPTQQSISSNSTLPPNSGGGLDSSACIIRNDTQGVLTTYRNASFSAEPVSIMPAGAEVNITVVFNGWYMLSYGNWVSGENVTVFGDCSQVWTATPTAIGDTNGGGAVNDGVPNCAVRNDSIDFVKLYQWADLNSPANGRMEAGEQANVYVGQNGWYQVYYAQWVNGADITLIGTDCNNLWIPTPTYQPGLSPTPMPTIPYVPSATPTLVPITPVNENWTHIQTVTEQGCSSDLFSGTVGEQSTHAISMERLGSVINLRIIDLEVTYTLNETSPNAFNGIFGKGPVIRITLNFTSSTSYTATVVVTHQTGCVAQSTWAGTKQ